MPNHLHRARDAIVSQEPHKRQHQTYAAYRLAVDRLLLELKTIDALIQIAKPKL